MSRYNFDQDVEGSAQGLVHPNRSMDCRVDIRAALPGTVILIHGVNDVGTFFPAGEEGLCAGLNDRLVRKDLKPASYSVPTKDDENKVVADPDDVYYKRKVDKSTHSPVIPFYWGYRPEGRPSANKGNKESTAHGQQVDQYGNRLDKDRSKGGGPFANATTSLPDMWNRGKWGNGGFLDWAADDPTRPVLDCPGRMYMVLAAYRMAALVAMIRDADDKETVSIVAHSQGCLVSLLAQAVLLEKGQRPVDTLIMNNPPYSLVDNFGAVEYLDTFEAGTDKAMDGLYGLIKDNQTLTARLTTLQNIVKGVWSKKGDAPALSTLKSPDCMGVVGTRWEPGADRDNRGKVYLYFSPEDMTVGLRSIQGIGWQGVPDIAHGSKIGKGPGTVPGYMGIPMPTGREEYTVEPTSMDALGTLGKGFRQRVFTIKKRKPAPGQTAQAVKVGETSPYKFVLLLKGEHVGDHLPSYHTVKGKGAIIGKEAPLPVSESEFNTHPDGVRKITGEVLATPVIADLYAGAVNAGGQDVSNGGYDHNDPIDAAIAASTDRAFDNNPAHYFELRSDPNPAVTTAMNGGPKADISGREGRSSPAPTVYPGAVLDSSYPQTIREVQSRLNANLSEEQQFKVLNVYHCCTTDKDGRRSYTGQILIKRGETAAEIRQRYQHGATERSMHGAIVGSVQNHRSVTSYDVSVGQGLVHTHPLFFAYLCAVADWRLKKPSRNMRVRPSILDWANFQKLYAKYWAKEDPWRKLVIEGNADYYSSGILPTCIPAVDKRPPLVMSETKALAGQPVAAAGTGRKS